jgi:hypothetical protein
VLSPENEPVAGAIVNSECQGEIKTTFSKQDGGYMLEFEDSKCPSGSWVEVKAFKDDMFGSDIGKVKNFFEEINLAMINIFTKKIIIVEEKVEEKSYEEIFIDGILLDEEVDTGGQLYVSVEIDNIKKQLHDVKVSVFIQELGLKISSKIDKLSSETSKRLLLDIPKDAKLGLYDVKIVISTDNLKRIKHRIVEIV